MCVFAWHRFPRTLHVCLFVFLILVTVSPAFAQVSLTTLGTPSQPSNTIRVDVETGPPAPLNLRAMVDGHRVTLAWSEVPGVDAYVLEAGTEPGLTDIGMVAAAAPSYVTDGVETGTYYVRVRAVVAGVTSGPSGEIAIVVP